MVAAFLVELHTIGNMSKASGNFTLNTLSEIYYVHVPMICTIYRNDLLAAPVQFNLNSRIPNRVGVLCLLNWKLN